MTPAQDALHEAAALETARYYSTASREYHPTAHSPSTVLPTPVGDDVPPPLRLIHDVA